MKTLRRIAGALTLAGCAMVTGPSGESARVGAVDAETYDASSRSSAELAEHAVSAQAPIAAAAIEELRRRGPEGHRALLEGHAGAVEALRGGLSEGEGSQRLRHAIDLVSGQRDGHASGLYWYTDLDEAQRVARDEGRPILSLRLLGRLDEELSCANSRFFRILLYSNPEVARHLRERFVLHWSSERPAPRITIDMGDGRQLVRTITGNSAHYVLDQDGRPLDVIVGLYSPDGFLRALRAAEEVAESCPGLQRECLSDAHREALAESTRAWEELRRRGATPLSYAQARQTLPVASTAPLPVADEAMELTVAKAFAERPMLRLIRPEPAAPIRPEPDWAQLGRQLGLSDELAPRTLALLRLKAEGSESDPAEVATALGLRALADGVRNELLFRATVRRWFLDRRAETRSFEALNRAVYGELMRTPAEDPWLGLSADDLPPRGDRDDAPRLSGARGAPDPLFMTASSGMLAA